MLRVALKSRWKYVVAVGCSAVFLAPMWIVLVTSLDDPGAMRSGASLLPSTLRYENYVEAWRSTNFLRQFLNSLFVALAVTAGQIVTSLMAGYAFARIRFAGRDLILMIVLSTIIVPFHVLVIPLFVLLTKLSWINTYWALIVPSLANAFGIFLFAQFFRTIPLELEEAAFVDGASRWRVLWQILVPLSRPAIATLFLFTFVAEWNELFKPLVFTSTNDMRTVQLGLTVFQEQFRVDYSRLMAAVVFTTLPTLLLFLVGQKQFVRGIATTGLR